MAHTFSRTWKSPAVLQRETTARFTLAQKQLCPRSPFFTRDTTSDSEQLIMSMARKAYDLSRNKIMLRDQRLRRRLEKARGRRIKIDLRHGKTVRGDTFRTIVLSHQSIWTKEWTEREKNEDKVWPFCTTVLHKARGEDAFIYPIIMDTNCDAPWPTAAECKHEGDERIVTGLANGRFLPMPRIPSNETVNFQQVMARRPLPFDDLHTKKTHDDIMFHNFIIPDQQITEEEAMEAMGSELMDALDPQTIYPDIGYKRSRLEIEESYDVWAKAAAPS